MATFSNRKLPPYYEEQAREQWAALEERTKALLQRLGAAETPEELRAIGEELAALPTTIRRM